MLVKNDLILRMTAENSGKTFSNQSKSCLSSSNPKKSLDKLTHADKENDNSMSIMASLKHNVYHRKLP